MAPDPAWPERSPPPRPSIPACCPPPPDGRGLGRFGPPGAFRAGDGATSVTVELVGEHATLTLSLVVDPASGLIRQADALP